MRLQRQALLIYVRPVAFRFCGLRSRVDFTVRVRNLRLPALACALPGQCIEAFRQFGE